MSRTWSWARGAGACGRGEVGEEGRKVQESYDMALLVCRCAAPLVPTGARLLLLLPSWMRGTPEAFAKRRGRASCFSAKENGIGRALRRHARCRALQGPPKPFFGSRPGGIAAVALFLVQNRRHMTAALMKCCRPHWPAGALADDSRRRRRRHRRGPACFSRESSPRYSALINPRATATHAILEGKCWLAHVFALREQASPKTRGRSAQVMN
ncbi:hypothetical protein B0J12DRAFT_264536 [Macrophomina phaseolina]|uniref:Uncharacterized protein n=1 Tax=Macrophomina phaseolina TaxID=35725 RepID=A0ABQ8FYL3_9PEZI|nr:hypothetical protein B0J12DRAFT_264536 [Macrophomina phaseolina]